MVTHMDITVVYKRQSVPFFLKMSSVKIK